MATYPWLTALDAVDREVDRERVVLLYRRVPVALLTVVVNSMLLAWFLVAALPAGPLFLWVGALWTITALRAALWRWYHVRAFQYESATWESLHLAGAALNGIGWGIGTAWFVGSDLLYAVGALFVAGGMIMGASLSSGTSMRSFAAYTVPAAAPAIGVMVLSGDPTRILMGVTSVLYCLAMTIMARQGGQVVVDTIRLRLQNAALGREIGGRTRDRAGRLQSLLDYSGVITIVADTASSRVVDASRNVEQLFGVAEDRLRGWSLIETSGIPQLASRAAWASFVAAARQEGGHRTLVRLTDPTRELEVSAVVRTLDHREYVLIVLSDVTEQRALEARLAEASLLASVGSVSREIAHEIRRPLAQVRESLQELSHAVEHGGSELRHLDRPVRVALEGSERIALAVADLNAVISPIETAPEAPAEGSAHRIVVIDDDPRVGQGLRRALYRHDVEVFDDPRAGLRRLLQGAPVHAVLCDLMMPQLSGMQVYAELRAHDPELAARVVFVTAGATTPEAASFVAEVPNRVLAKPVSSEQLEEAIQFVHAGS